jgi:hypothetical protein
LWWFTEEWTIGSFPVPEDAKMADVQVTCINKPNRASSHEHITHLGGSTWKWTRAQVITSIEAKTNTFFVRDAAGHRSEVGVVEPSDDRSKYVRTYADGDWNNNLLALPECP